MEAGGKALVEIQIVAPTIMESAAAAWDAAGQLVYGVLRVNGRAATPGWQPLRAYRQDELRKLDETCRLATIAFIAAAQDESVQLTSGCGDASSVVFMGVDKPSPCIGARHFRHDAPGRIHRLQSTRFAPREIVAWLVGLPRSFTSSLDSASPYQLF